MSEINLVLLGLIKKQPQSAYDLQKNIEYRNLSQWVKMSNSSIYNNVNQLQNNGYITGSTIQNSNMPPKVIFTITELGEKYLTDLMLKTASQKIKLIFDFNSVILNLDCIDLDAQKCCLESISAQMHLLQEHMTASKNAKSDIPPIGQSILTQQLYLTEYLKQWLNDLQETVNTKQKEKTK